jgi:hypothetical protein
MPEAAETARQSTLLARELTVILEEYSQLLLLPDTEARTDIVSQLAVDKIRELLIAFGATEEQVKRAIEDSMGNPQMSAAWERDVTSERKGSITERGR